MHKITYKLVFNRKKSLNRGGRALVQVEAYQCRHKKYFSTHVYLLPDQWDARRQRVKHHPNSSALNFLLRKLVNDIEQRELQLWQQGKEVSLEMLKEAWCKPENKELFVEFCVREVRLAGLKESTRRNLNSTLQLLRKFQPQARFADLNFAFVSNFEIFLRENGYHINTIAKHTKHLRRLVNLAVRKNLLDMQANPFQHYRIKTIPGRHTHLTPEELEKLEQCCPPAERHQLQHTLDAFLFCCYAGLRYSDFVSLTSDNLACVGQEHWLVYRSVKTGTEVRLPLSLLFEGKALAILNKYADRLDEFFRLQGNSSTNKSLRLLGQMAGVDKHISFHTARHTNATLLIYRGVNITTVQKLLGHKSVRTTQVYANVMDQTLLHDLQTHRI